VSATPTGEPHFVTVGPIKAGHPVGVTYDGKVVSLHQCVMPEALAHDGDEWTCPGCGKTYERHWDAWWQERDE
jgi:hypothetical protein